MVIPALRRWRGGNKKFKANLSYIVSFSLTWVTLLEEKRKKQQEKDKAVVPQSKSLD